jgi:hypothetical protein
VNTPVPIIFAHGEQLIPRALLLIASLVFIIYPMALWVLANSRDRSHRRSVVWCGVVLALVCSGGVVATLKEFTWPPELGDFIGFLIWAIPAACGVAALLKVASSAKHERDLSN